MKFKKIIQPTNPGQVYDLKESVQKAGEKYVYYDRIQAARQDTELYPTLKKYGTIEPMMVNKELLYQDIRNFKTDLRSLKEMTMQADEMWNRLPGDLKAKFDNNRDIFMRDGEKWLKSELEKAQPAQPTTETKEQTNE